VLTRAAASAALAVVCAACTGGSDAAASRVGPDSAACVGGCSHPADGCHPPAGVTALCLEFEPEAVVAEAEPGLDEHGSLFVQIFDTPNPPGGAAASAVALYERTVPADAASGVEIALSDLPVPTIVLADSTSTVYLRALFFDHGGFNQFGGIAWGTWLGGLDLSRGLVNDTTLVPVSVTPGGVTTVSVPLTALRRLTATVTTSVKPLGDGEGALSVTASPIQALSPNAPTYGYGIDPCVDVTKGPQTVEMILLGSGKFYVVGYFDDLGIQTPGSIPPGTLLSLRDVDISTGSGTYDEIMVAADQYSGKIAIDLGYVTEFRGSPSAVGPNSCADLGLPYP
jgi:hypothetical protein